MWGEGHLCYRFLQWQERRKKSNVIKLLFRCSPSTNTSWYLGSIKNVIQKGRICLNYNNKAGYCITRFCKVFKKGPNYLYSIKEKTIPTICFFEAF